MRRPALGAVLLAVLAGCGGERPLAPTPVPSSNPGATSTSAHAEGALCDWNGGPPDVARCAAAGITATVATIPLRVSQGGTIQLSAITRYLGFEEYPFFTLTCNGVDSRLTAVSGKPVAQPASFASVPGVTPELGAVDLELTGRVPGNSSCQLAFSFDVDSSFPYTPYDVTVKIETP